MVSKEDFLNYIEIVKENRKSLAQLNQITGGDFYGCGFAQLVNDSDYIAKLLLDVPKNNKRFSLMYWEMMINNGKFRYGYLNKDTNEYEQIKLNSWSEFYDYWRQFIEKTSIT